LVHGDLVRKNLRIRIKFGTADFFAVDWENTGVGSPATDLARSPSVTGLSDLAAAPSITAYRSSVRRHWTDLSSADLRETANIGLIFRCLSSIQWEAERLDANGYVDRCMPRLAIFRDVLTEAMAEAGWSHS
jgi:thiamine kinase-like enzyme